MLHAGNDILRVRKRTSIPLLPVRWPGVWHFEETGRENNRRQLSPGKIAAKHVFHGGFRGDGWPRKFNARRRPIGAGKAADQIEHITDGEQLIFLPPGLDRIGDSISPFCEAA